MNTEDRFFDLSTPEGRVQALARHGGFGELRGFISAQSMRAMVFYIGEEIEKYIEQNETHNWQKEGF